MEIGLITPPVGLNLFVLNSIAPDVPTREILWGALPYLLVMMLALAVLCVFPQIVTSLPESVTGHALKFYAARAVFILAIGVFSSSLPPAPQRDCGLLFAKNLIF